MNSALLEEIRNYSVNKKIIQIINETYKIYFKKGSRSPEKVNYFHSSIIDILIDYFPKSKGYDIKREYKVQSDNAAKEKKCDIVILKNNEPYIIIPVKIPMSNYRQNRNNSYENLTGELSHIKWAFQDANRDIIIIPINIFMNKTPYLRANKTIKNFETITNNDIEIYKKLKGRGLCYEVLNYIVEVKHCNKEDECFTEIEPITAFHTKYKPFISIFKELM